MDEQLEFMKQIASRLDAEGIPYMMTGSMAMAIYSIPRMTRDIDLVIEISSDDAGKIIGLFENDCYIDEESIKDAIRNEGMFNIIHNEWVIKADFIIRKSGAYRQKEFTRRTRVDIDGTAIWVVAPEDLILSKLVWAKPSRSGLQQRDVRQMIQTISTLDWKYLDEWAGVLGVKALLENLKSKVKTDE